MKILLIITRLDQGGSAEAVMQIGEGLFRKGHEVEIITGLTNEPQEDFKGYTERTGVPIKAIPELRRKINPFFDIWALSLLYRLIKKENPSVVHTHTSKAGVLGRWAARLGGVKMIIHSTHGHVFYGYFGWIKTTFFLWIEKITAKITNKITTLTDLEIEDYLSLRLARREKFITIPFGIDTKRYQQSDTHREKTRQGLGLSSEDFVIGWIGRLVPVKDCGTFIRASSLLNPSPSRGGGIKFLVVGDGPEREKMEDMADYLGLKGRLIFTGTRKDIYDIMSTIDLLVLSSLNEGLGRVVLEAMAAGKPVIATKVGGVPEVVEDGITGIIVSPQNPPEMASAIMSIMRDPEKARIIGEVGKKRVERFDIKIAVDRLERLYKAG